MTTLQEAITRTLIYHDIFEYPLSLQELQRYLIGVSCNDLKKLKEEAGQCPTAVCKNNRYYLAQAPYIYQQEYAQNSWKHLKKTQTFAKKLFAIFPQIQLLAVSGSTAALYATKESDIDLFMITKKDSSWTIRALILLLLSWKKQRIQLKADRLKTAGKFCLNLIFEHEETDIAFPKKDLFTAMEFAHLKVIINRDSMYQKTLHANEWIKKYLPNFYAESEKTWVLPEQETNQHQKKQGNFIMKELNRICKWIQETWYRKQHENKLTLNNTWVIDHRTSILEKYQKKCTEYKL